MFWFLTKTLPRNSGALFVVAIGLLLVATPIEGIIGARAQSVPSWFWGDISTAYIDNMMSGREAKIRNSAGKFATDLPKSTEKFGFCKSALQRAALLVSSPWNRCVSQAIAATTKACSNLPKADPKKPLSVFQSLKNCAKYLSGFKGSDREIFQRFAGQVGGKLVGSSATQILGSMQCAAAVLVDYSGLPPFDKKRAVEAINGTTNKLVDIVALSNLSEKLATEGISAWKPNISGNDGDKNSTSALDWMIEAEKIANDPTGQVRSRALGPLASIPKNRAAAAFLERAMAKPDGTILRGVLETGLKILCARPSGVTSLGHSKCWKRVRLIGVIA